MDSVCTKAEKRVRTKEIKMQNNIFSKQYLFIILLISVLISPALAFADADKVFKENNKAVVVVKTYNEKGQHQELLLRDELKAF